MKKLLIKTSIAGLSFMAFSTVYAQSATSAAINFTGRLTHATCAIVVADREQTIDFKEVPASTEGFDTINVGGVANAAYTRPIDINLQNCSAPQGAQPDGVAVSVTGPDVVTTAGRLKTNNPALHIQLLEGANDTPWNISNRSQRIPLVAGNNTLKFKARYYVIQALSTSSSTALTTASAIFNLHYN